MTRYAVLSEPHMHMGQENVAARVVVIVSDDEGRSWRPYTPVFSATQIEVAYTIAEAMNSRAAVADADVDADIHGIQLRLEQL